MEFPDRVVAYKIGPRIEVVYWLNEDDDLCVTCGKRITDRHQRCQQCKEASPLYRNPFVK